ncbi:MAG: RES family NAD+ phosphorylase [Longimicrobiales bacterium]
MILWRLTRSAFQQFDGEGARLNGGRWNSEGIAVVYLSSTLSLAALEYLVHVDIEDVPDDLVALEIELPDDVSMEEVLIEDLPADWNKSPDHPACLRRGDEWVQAGSSVLLRVPSAIIVQESNYLLNPAHPDAARILVRDAKPFTFDARLFEA